MPKVSATALVFVVLLHGCTVPEPRQDVRVPSAPRDFPEAYYRRAISQGVPVFEVDAAHSLVVIEVRRGGSLARLGHDHVVASHRVEGYIAPKDRRADLYVALAELVVDEPELRAEAGLDTQPSAEAIEGTRRNMLDKVLEVEQHPFAVIRVMPTANDGEPRAMVTLTLHGATRTLEVPIRLEQRPREVAVSGRLALNQTDFGIVPFSILGGAITVQDRVDVRFAITAREVAP